MKINFYDEDLRSTWIENIMEITFEETVLVCTANQGSNVEINIDNIIIIRDDGY